MQTSTRACCAAKASTSRRATADSLRCASGGELDGVAAASAGTWRSTGKLRPRFAACTSSDPGTPPVRDANQRASPSTRPSIALKGVLSCSKHREASTSTPSTSRWLERNCLSSADFPRPGAPCSHTATAPSARTD